MKYNGKKIQIICNRMALTCLAITGYASIAGKQSGTPWIILFLGWTIIALIIFALGFFLRRLPIIARKYKNRVEANKNGINTRIIPNEQIEPHKVELPLDTQSAINDDVTSLKRFLQSNHDFSTGKGPEIRDWASGGHSLILHKGDQTIMVHSPKNDNRKLSIPFVVSSIVQNMDNLVVCKTLDEHGNDCYVLMDKIEFATDTQATALNSNTQEDLTLKTEEQKEKILMNKATFAGSIGAIRFCRYCGEKIPEDSKYCPYCGRSLNFYKSSSAVSTILDNNYMYLWGIWACVCIIFPLCQHHNRNVVGAITVSLSLSLLHYFLYKINIKYSKHPISFDFSNNNLKTRCLKIAYLLFNSLCILGVAGDVNYGHHLEEGVISLAIFCWTPSAIFYTIRYYYLHLKEN